MYTMSELEPMGNWARRYRERAIAENHSSVAPRTGGRVGGGDKDRPGLRKTLNRRVVSFLIHGGE